MRKRWIAKPSPDEAVFQSLKAEVQTSDILLYLMAQRGMSSGKEALAYFQPSLEMLHSPFLMRDMETAVSRIMKATEAGETIVVYGDYDVDGTTSVALVYSFLSKLHPNLHYYIPDRFKEGYGISMAGIDWAASLGATLVIALDCGIKSMEHTLYAREKGIDFIICDHHTPGDFLPEAFAVLNPKREDCSYPYKELSGCGIGFKLVHAIAERMKLHWDPMEYLDLVAISISSDIVQMTGENRILTFFGLQKVNSDPRPGVKALIALSGPGKSLDVNDLVFRLGPRINAAGRISSGKLAVEMLIEKDEDKALNIASEVNKNNVHRQGVDQVMTKEALEMIEKQGLADRKTTVLFNKEWHKGVIGIVASRLIEKHYRPTILLTESNGYAVGSARSVQGFDLYQAIKACDELLEQWGGHQAAAGLTLPVEKIEEFSEKFELAVQNSITDELLVPVIEYDLEIPLRAATLTFCRSINRFGPFGPENMRPVFITKEVSCFGTPRIVGNNHLQISITDGDGVTHKGIGFNLGGLFAQVQKAESFDICYTADINEFRGTQSVSLNIKDIQFG